MGSSTVAAVHHILAEDDVSVIKVQLEAKNRESISLRGQVLVQETLSKASRTVCKLERHVMANFTS